MVFQNSSNGCSIVWHFRGKQNNVRMEKYKSFVPPGYIWNQEIIPINLYNWNETHILTSDCYLFREQVVEGLSKDETDLEAILRDPLWHWDGPNLDFYV